MKRTRAQATRGAAMASAACLCLAFPLGAHAQGERALSVVWENDMFSLKDQHYTNGMQFSWDGKGEPPAWALRAARSLPWVDAGAEARHGYVFGQNMYTAMNIKLAEPPPDEPPYAGWLYGGIGLRVWNDIHSEHFSLLVGVIGPAALGEQAQKFVHKLVDATEPAGWDTQLDNEPGVVLAYQRSWRRVVRHLEGGLESDLRPHAGVALGNVRATTTGLRYQFFAGRRIHPAVLGEYQAAFFLELVYVARRVFDPAGKLAFTHASHYLHASNNLPSGLHGPVFFRQTSQRRGFP